MLKPVLNAFVFYQFGQICLWNSYLVVIYRDLDPSADLELQILANWKSEPAVLIMLRFGDLVRMRLISVSYIYIYIYIYINWLILVILIPK